MKALHDLPQSLQNKFLTVTLIEQYLEVDSSGGIFQEVLNEQGCADEQVTDCHEIAKRNEDVLGTLLGSLLLGFDEDTRLELVESPWDTVDDIKNMIDGITPIPKK